MIYHREGKRMSDGAIESSSSGSTGLCGYDGISDDRSIYPKSGLGLDETKCRKNFKV